MEWRMTLERTCMTSEKVKYGGDIRHLTFHVLIELIARSICCTGKSTVQDSAEYIVEVVLKYLLCTKCTLFVSHVQLFTPIARLGAKDDAVVDATGKNHRNNTKMRGRLSFEE